MRFIRKLWQDGIVVAEVDAPTKEEADREIHHYAMMYSQDGEVVITEK